MKLAVISDMHGNLSALEAALADIEAVGATNIVCLGDVASFGPQPQETLGRIKELGCPVVMGNADAEMLAATADKTLPAHFSDIIRWCAEQLDEKDLGFIRTFRKTVRLELEGVPILLFHGSPKSYNDIITATTPDEELEGFFEPCAPLMFGGHTHAQILRRYQDLTFLNPGSVGLPYEILADGTARNPARAEYALVEVVRGQPSVTFRRVPYDLAPLLDAVRRSGMPHGKTWSAAWKV